VQLDWEKNSPKTCEKDFHFVAAPCTQASLIAVGHSRIVSISYCLYSIFLSTGVRVSAWHLSCHNISSRTNGSGGVSVGRKVVDRNSILRVALCRNL
jgi:hypothetical protein